MRKKLGVLSGSLLFGAVGLLAGPSAEHQVKPMPPDDELQKLWAGLPPQEQGSARLAIGEYADVDLEVSVQRSTPACDELQVFLQVFQGGTTRVSSSPCLSRAHPDGLIELVVGQEARRQYYRIEFDYSVESATVAYSLERIVGPGVIQSQRVAIPVGPGA